MLKKIVRVLHIGADNIGYGGRSVIAYRLTQHMSFKIQNDFLVFKQIDEFYENEVKSKNGELILIDGLPDKRKRIRYEWMRSNKIIRKIREKQYDIVHIHADNAYEALKSAVLVRIAGFQYIFVHAHNTGSDKKYGVVLKIIISISKKIVLRIANETFACSMEAAKYLFGNPPDNVHIIKNGIDINQYIFNVAIREKKRREMGWENNYIVGCVARLSLQKNHLFLLDIFEKIVEIRPDAILVLIGEGKCRAIIEKRAIEKGLHERIRMLGNRKDVPELLQAMDVFVLTSCYEGFGIVNIEAQVSGLPCVVSNVIPQSAKVSNTFYMLGLDEPLEKWARIICNIKVQSREIDIKTFDDKGFNIVKSALYLEKIYIKYGTRE